MKKILKSSIIVTLIFFSIVGYLSYSYNIGYSIIEKNVPISINQEKDSLLSNEEYVNIIENLAKESELELVYLNQSSDKSTSILNYYVTNNTGMYSEYTSATNENGELMYPSYFTKSKIYPFEDISKYSLERMQVFVDGTQENINSFVDNLNNMGNEAYIIEDSYYSIIPFMSFTLLKLYIIILGVLFFIFLFYQITKAKKLVLRKLNGYSLLDTLKEDIIDFNKFLFIILVILLILTTLLFVSSSQGLWYYLIYYFKINILFILAYNFIFVLTLILIYNVAKINSLKNNIIGNKYFNLIYLFKFGLIIMIMIAVTSLSSEIPNYKLNYQEYEQTKDLYDYSYIPIYDPNIVDDVNINIFDDTFFEKLINFYYATEGDLKGIIGTFDYPYPITEEDLETIREETGDPNFTFNFIADKSRGYVNERYLEYNKVYDENNNQIVGSNLPKNKITILIPNKYKGDEKLEEYLKQEETDLCQTGFDSETERAIYEEGCNRKLNVIYTQNDTEYRVVNDTREEFEDGIAIDPIVEVITKDTEKEFFKSEGHRQSIGWIVSTGGYIVKTNQEDPYSIVKPYIEKVGLENFIRETPLVSNYKLELLNNIKLEMIGNLLLLFYLFIGLIGSIYYLIKTKIALNSKKYSLQIVSAQSIDSILKKEYMKISIFYIAIIVGTIILYNLNDTIILGGMYRVHGLEALSYASIIVFICFMISEVVLLRIVFYKDIIRELKDNIKGDK